MIYVTAQTWRRRTALAYHGDRTNPLQMDLLTFDTLRLIRIEWIDIVDGSRHEQHLQSPLQAREQVDILDKPHGNCQIDVVTKSELLLLANIGCSHLPLDVAG